MKNNINLYINNYYLYSRSDLQALVHLTDIMSKDGGLWYRFKIIKVYYHINNYRIIPFSIVLNQHIISDYIFNQHEIITNISEI